MKTKRLLYLTGMMVLIFSIVSPVAAFSGTGFSPDSPTSPASPDAFPYRMYLPGVFQQIFPYQLSGQVKDAEDNPVSGAIVSTDTGRMGVTDANGVYRMTTTGGAQEISVAKTGYNFQPASANLTIENDMNNLNFSAISASLASVATCSSTLLSNSDFEIANPNPLIGGWTIRDVYMNGKNKSRYTDTAWVSPATSMLSGVPTNIINPFPGEWTTGEFYQTTSAAIPSNATIVQLQVHLLPRSTDLWGYHLSEQAAMIKATGDSYPDISMAASSTEAATQHWEAQYGFVCTDGSNTDTCNPANGGKMLFKWYPIDSYWWLFRAYDLRAFRGQTVSILFGASNDGYNGNTALYVDNAYLYYCTP